MLRVLARVVVVVVLVCAGSSALADDWLDDMPTVERVAQVAVQEVIATDKPQEPTANLMATMLILLRQAMQYRAAADPAMTPERRDRMNRIDAQYQLAELAIGAHVGTRSGAMTVEQARAYYESRRYEPCATEVCYQYELKQHLDWWGAANLRQLVLPLLMPCDTARELLDLVQQRILEAPSIPPTPVLSHTLSESAKSFATVPKVAACGASGLDIDGDGACFDWEARLLELKAQARLEPSCKPLNLISATTNDADSVTVRYELGPDFTPQPLRFEVCRAAHIAIKSCNDALTERVGNEVVSAPDSLKPGLHDATILEGHVLRPDPKMPYVVVFAESVGHRSQTYFQKRAMGVLVHGYAFSRLVAFGQVADKLIKFVGLLDDQVDEELVEAVIRQWDMDNEDVEEWQSQMEESLESISCYDKATFAFNWRLDSNLKLASILAARGRELAKEVARQSMELRTQHEGDVVDLHFIGHSRGTVIIGQALKEWSERPDISVRGSYIRVTLLDPHPADNRLSPQESALGNALNRVCFDTYKLIQSRLKDPLVVLPNNVGIREATVWYQQSTWDSIKAAHDVPTNDDLMCPLNLWGRPQSGTNITNESDVRLTEHNLTGATFKDGEVMDHSLVVRFYGELIKRGATASCTPPP